MNLNLSELARAISSENDVDVDRSGSSLAVIEFLTEKKHIAELILYVTGTTFEKGKRYKVPWIG